MGHGPQGGLAVFVLTERAGVAGIPSRLDGVTVVPRVVGKIVALCHKGGTDPKGCDNPPPPPDGGSNDCTSTTERFRPACIGISTGHPAITAGTIGARVTDGTDVYALSNNHVYADENLASIGDAVIQPGTFDGGSSPADDIGNLSDFELINFNNTYPFLPNYCNGSGPHCNVMDAAIAVSNTADLGNATPSDGYGTPKSATVAASINQKVKKYGRTTGETKGQVIAINAIVDVGYSAGVARFVDQIIISPGTFSAGGDSGSLIVDDSKGKDKTNARKPVGLLFAGSSLVTIANPIDAVLDRFGVTIDGE